MSNEPAWEDAAGLRPRLRDHVRIHRHRYRGRRWYVLQDEATGRFMRFTPEAHYLIALMDGSRRLREILEEAQERYGEAAPSTDQVLAIMAQLHAADVLMTERVPEGAELVKRASTRRRQELLGPWLSPLAIRIPLLDPDRVLDRLIRPTAWLFSRWGALLWLLVVVAGAASAAIHWDGLTEDVTDRVLATENLILLFLVYPLVKAIHELGHGLAVKRWGGEVHEMGIMLLVFIPVPYVDASASIALSSRWRRMLVAGIGILVELFLAALAMLVWAEAEPGATRAVAYNVMLIAGVSTLFFNGNPLLRFDGYFVLQDLLEIPNLGTRANRHYGYLARRYLLRQPKVQPIAPDVREATWLTLYGLASFAYRIFIITAIVLLVADRFFFVGVILAVWALYNALLRPLIRQLGTLLFDAGLIGHRGRAGLRAGMLVTAVLLLLAVVPMPYSTFAHGVVRAPDEAALRMPASGEVAELLAQPGQRVAAGQEILRLRDPVLEAEVALYRAQAAEAEARLLAARTDERVAEANARTVHELAESRLADAEQRLERLVVRSEREGLLLIDGLPEDLPGLMVERGQLMGYVLAQPPDTVRVAVDMDQVDQVRRATVAVELLSTARRDQPIAGSVLREVPSATDELPSEALAVDGGGPFALDPTARPERGRRPQGPRSLRPLFQFDVRSAQPFDPYRLDQRVFVKFVHPAEPLARRWYRALRQLFLSRFDV